MRSRAAPTLLILSLVATGAVCATPPAPRLAPLATAERPVSYRDEVAPVLEGRCAVCHGCYDAPCQLLLTSPEGIARGASKETVYHASRLTATAPTRLGIDATGPAAWRERGFRPVLPEGEGGPDGALLLRMLALGRAHPFAPDARLPDGFPLDITRELSCPTGEEFDAYAAREPLGGMPYGMAPLADAELATLAAWVGQGAPVPDPPPLPAAAREQIATWEAFLNGSSLKQRITARYLYEHWFLAHLYFESLPEGPFFRVVRSSTAPGAPPREIATRRPYDDPDTERFWYRLVPLEETIVHKTHMVYVLGPERLDRLRALFLEAEWEPTRLPGYEADEASNPFVTFDQIPARSRYRFLLDDARFFVMSFIRGPVCHGQVAVDVIEDHFFVAFLDPESDLSVRDPAYLEETKELLSLPAEHASRYAPGGLWLEYQRKQREYLEVRERFYDAADPARRGPGLESVWDGDGTRRDALLTVFRHFDNASVVRGFVGAFPETAWIIDYPIFERIYYDLVAGFDVFGNVTHQVATRLYMDHLRMQAETLFLEFLPPGRREAVRASWYVGATDDFTYHTNRIRSTGHGTRVRYETSDEPRELLERILERNRGIAGPPDLLNRCQAPPCDRPDATSLERRAERALQPLAGVRGPWVATLPELVLLRVRDETPGAGVERHALYSLVHEKAHTNVASMFDEQDRREPGKDTLTVVRGILGSYPNFLFDVPVAEIEAFATELASVDGGPALEALADRFGVRRTSPRFWETFDQVHRDMHRRDPTRAGLLDLNRYENL